MKTTEKHCLGCGAAVEPNPSGIVHCAACGRGGMTQERFDRLVSRGFDRGNYCNAYETTDFERAQRQLVGNGDDDPYRVGFVLGFFGSYELHEMGSDADTYREAWASEAGQRARAIGIDVPESLEEETDEEETDEEETNE